MALEVQTSQELCLRVGNLALQRMGSSKTVTSLSQPSREAMTLSLHWDHQFRAILRQFPWPFATKYAELPLAPSGGSSTALGRAGMASSRSPSARLARARST